MEKIQDPMARRFLELVRDAVRQRGSEEATEEVRSALRALAEAIEQLPPVRVELLDTGRLRHEAAALLREAEGEPDGVIADSVQRRAQAMFYRAEAHDHSALVARRTEVLRSEIEAQMAALREGLAALDPVCSTQTGLPHLADAARRVASEARVVASAREELDRSLGTIGMTPPEGVPVVIHSGRG